MGECQLLNQQEELPKSTGCIQKMLNCRGSKFQVAELLHHQHCIRDTMIAAPLLTEPFLQLYGAAVLIVQMCMQELLRRRRAFVMAMAELLRRRRAIRDAMMAVPHPDPTLGGTLCSPSCCMQCKALKFGQSQSDGASAALLHACISGSAVAFPSPSSQQVWLCIVGSAEPIMEHESAGVPGKACNRGILMLAGISNSWLRMFDLTERMRNNLEKDHSLVRRFTGGVVHQVTPFLQDSAPRCHTVGTPVSIKHRVV